MSKGGSDPLGSPCSVPMERGAHIDTVLLARITILQETHAGTIYSCRTVPHGKKKPMLEQGKSVRSPLVRKKEWQRQHVMK